MICLVGTLTAMLADVFTCRLHKAPSKNAAKSNAGFISFLLRVQKAHRRLNRIPSTALHS